MPDEKSLQSSGTKLSSKFPKITGQSREFLLRNTRSLLAQPAGLSSFQGQGSLIVAVIPVFPQAQTLTEARRAGLRAVLSPLKRLRAPEPSIICSMPAQRQGSWLELELSASTFHMLLFPVRYTGELAPSPPGTHFPGNPVLHSCGAWCSWYSRSCRGYEDMDPETMMQPATCRMVTAFRGEVLRSRTL